MTICKDSPGCQQIAARCPGSFTPSYWAGMQAEQGDRDCDLGSFCRLDELRLQVVDQRLEPGRAVLAGTIETNEFARWCRRCGCEPAPRNSVTRRLAHEPLRWCRLKCGAV